MAGSNWKKSAGLAALAVALFAAGAPSLAAAQEDSGRRGNWGENRGGGRDGGGQGGWRQQQQSQSQAPAPQPQSQAAPSWGGGNRGGGNGGGWQARQAEAPQPAPQAVPQPVPVARGDWGGGWRGRGAEAEQRNRSVSEPGTQPGWMSRRSQSAGNEGNAQPRGEWRSRGWGAPQQSGEAAPRRGDWAGNRGQQQGWTGPTTPPPPVEARRAEGNRDGWNGRNRSYSDPNRDRSYGEDLRRREGDRQGWRDGDRQGWRDGDRRREANTWSNNNRWGSNDRRDGDRWREGRNWREGGERRRGPGSQNYSPNRHGSWWSNYGWNDGSWRNNRHDYYRDGRWRNWDRNWRNDRRYDWFGWRNNHYDWYRLDSYYAPYRNYYYRRLSIGFFLDALFYSERYWIDDPWSYRLPEVYGPYRWVRYYDDVLLVNIYTGEVVDVIHDFFW